ncbi:nuclear transport factor 2 family protein [Novosphingobium sp.]|uniref:nuclear transport factor 2 family protein n=1 Tax=Novosphingobium sp. TaxID=1874826 RepID=UPI0025EFF8A7|nr:nuclear transport factor 2 family protein [Novosphingobium sp.]
MTDTEAIAAIKARYCMAVDLCATDPEGARGAMAPLFTADATADYGAGPVTGADAIAGFLATNIAANSAWMLHMLHTPLIAVDGDAATGDWTVMVHCKRRESQDIDTIVGRYSDTFRRGANGAWRIAHVRFIRNN